MKMRLYFLLLIFLAVCPSASSAPAVTLVIKEKEGYDNLECKVKPETGLAFGLIPSGKKRTLELVIENRLKVQVRLEGWRSPCTCLIFTNVPDKLGPGERRSLTAELDGAAYYGSFAKHMYLAFETDEDMCESFLPISFSVGKITRENINKTVDGEIIKGVCYPIIKDASKRSLDSAVAWLFASPTCPSCNFLKRKVLPALFSDKSGKNIPDVIIADLGAKSNVILLIELEKHYGIKNNKTPVLFSNGHFYHGVNAIKKLKREELPESGNMPNFHKAESSKDFLKQHAETIKISAIIFGGLTDGINPCVFATLIFFVSLLATSGVRERKLLMVGSVYCLACFICYTLLGLGLFEALKAASSYKWIQHIFNWGLIGFLIIFAMLSFKDAFKFSKSGKAKDVTLQLSDSMKSKIHSIMRKGLKSRYLIPGAFLIGVFVTIIESVCTGQIYIPVLALMIKNNEPGSYKWISYLLLYNLMFIIPLIVIFLCVWHGTTMKTLLDWSRQNVVFGKIAMGIFFLLMAGVMILVF
jgi:cytochrome c biogenesis protein CcdA/glutaredoxin